MERSIFFNSAPGDPRTYQASDFADYFGDVLSSGLLHTDSLPALQVLCDGMDLRTYVEPGKALIQGYAYENTTDLYLQHALPEATLDRIDRIVLRLDKRNQSRFIKLFVLQGIAAATPVAPTLQRDEFIYELSLAQIRVRANTSTLVPADLVDERLNENLCGLVNSLLTVPTSQFQAEWDTYMTSKQSQIDAESLAYEQQLAQNLIDYENEFNSWFDGLQTTGFASQTEFANHKTDDVSHNRYGVDIGTANAKVITLNPVPTSLVAGFSLRFKNDIANTGAVTLNVNGLGAKAIVKNGGVALSSGNLKAGGLYTVAYDGTSFILQGEGGSGNAVASDLLSGKTATTDAGEITGTMDLSNLIPSNIKKGVTINNVNGSFNGYSQITAGSNSVAKFTGSASKAPVSYTTFISLWSSTVNVNGSVRLSTTISSASTDNGVIYQYFVGETPVGPETNLSGYSTLPYTMTLDTNVSAGAVVSLRGRKAYSGTTTTQTISAASVSIAESLVANPISI
jgi:hypothetical protein